MNWAIPYLDMDSGYVRIQCKKCGMLMPKKIWDDLKEEGLKNWHCGNCGNGTGENFIPNDKPKDSECKHERVKEEVEKTSEDLHRVVKIALTTLNEKILDEEGILKDGVVRYEFTREEIDNIIKTLEEK